MTQKRWTELKKPEQTKAILDVILNMLFDQGIHEEEILEWCAKEREYWAARADSEEDRELQLHLAKILRDVVAKFVAINEEEGSKSHAELKRIEDDLERQGKLHPSKRLT